MQRTKTVLIGTILLLGNLSVALQARALAPVNEIDVRQIESSISENIGSILYSQGLDKAVAYEKAKHVFGVNELHATIGIQNLLAHYENISVDSLHKVVAKRALFDKKVDLASYDALVSLVHEIKGTGLERKELHTLRQVAAVNRSLMEQWS